MVYVTLCASARVMVFLFRKRVNAQDVRVAYNFDVILFETIRPSAFVWMTETISSNMIDPTLFDECLFLIPGWFQPVTDRQGNTCVLISLDFT